MSTSMVDAQDKQRGFHDKGVKMRTFQKGDTVMAGNMRGGIDKWITCVVIAIKGPLTCLVRCGCRVRYAHCEHMQNFLGDNSSPSTFPEENHRPETFQEPIVSRSSQPQENTASTEAAPSDGNDNGEAGNSQPTSYEAIPERRHPIRSRKPLVKYGAS